ncbi:hypothetical protein ACI782_22255 [Geodermatophilus sp. SYSU D00703]
MSTPRAPEGTDPDRPAVHDEAVVGEPAGRREYRRPRAFLVGPAPRLVRGGLYGKAQDGYTGYYMEP